MEIQIRGYLAASFLLDHEPRQWHTIVLLDSGSRGTDFVAQQSIAACQLRFDDIEQPQTGRLLPTSSAIQEALDFAQGKEKLLVTCRAGQGRSAALAYVIAAHRLGINPALQLLNPTRHRPNRLVVEIGTQILNAADILDAFEAWRREYGHIKLSDYYDEMEREFDTLEAMGASNKITQE